MRPASVIQILEACHLRFLDQGSKSVAKQPETGQPFEIIEERIFMGRCSETWLTNMLVESRGKGGY